MKAFIIDDDNISIFLTQYVLKEAGFQGEILSFLSAEEALEILLQNFPANLPQIILLDLNMPGMNGWEFLDALASYNEQLLNYCKIYVLTSSLNVTDTAKAKDYALVCELINKAMKEADVQMVLFQSKNQKTAY